MAKGTRSDLPSQEPLQAEDGTTTLILKADALERVIRDLYASSADVREAQAEAGRIADNIERRAENAQR